jgi:hypothetical protein
VNGGDPAAGPGALPYVYFNVPEAALIPRLERPQLAIGEGIRHDHL